MVFKGLFADRPQVGELLPNGRQKLRWTHDAKGRVLQSDSGMVYVPCKWDGKFWSVVVVVAPVGRWTTAYPRGGYDLMVSNAEVESDPEIRIERLEDY